LGTVDTSKGSGTGHLTVICAYLTGEKGHVFGIDLQKEIIEYSKDKLTKFEKQSSLKFKNITWQVRNCFIPDTENPDLKYDRIHSVLYFLNM
jgi:tRNA A58 N-methylase Trm61